MRTLILAAAGLIGLAAAAHAGNGRVQTVEKVICPPELTYCFRSRVPLEDGPRQEDLQRELDNFQQHGAYCARMGLGSACFDAARQRLQSWR